MAAKSGATPWFLSVWLLFWSLGVGVLSGLVSSQGGILWLFICTHGGAELLVGWIAASSFEKAVAGTIDGVSTEPSMSGITARWQSRGKSLFILTWFVILGILMGGILAAGTWGPVVLGEGETMRLVVASVLSVAWSTIGWRWAVALRGMIRMLGSFTLTASFDRLVVTHRRGVVEVVHELPMAGLRVKAEDAELTFTAGAESFTVPCALGPERKAMLASISELSRKAEAPGAASDVPEALASLMSRREPAAER